MPNLPPPPDSGTATGTGVAAALAGLSHASTRLHPDEIPAVAAAEATKLGVTEFAIYLVDLEQRALVPFQATGDPAATSLAVDGTMAGRAYRLEQPVVMRAEEGCPDGGTPGGLAAWLPLLDSAERLGVVHVRVRSDALDPVADCLAFCNLLGEIIANKSSYGDVVAATRRTQELTIGAELRWSVLPPLTFTGRNFTVSGILEPAYAIAGDTFDYAVNGDTAHVAIIDAVGHGLEAARIANLAVASYRHSRRRGLDHVQTYYAMDAALAAQLGWEKFATAQLATLTLSTGRLCWLNAGHPPPLVVRQGHTFDLTAEACLPVGLAYALAAEAEVSEVYLEPDDVVLFFTDGVVEARSADGEQFGRDRLADLMVRTTAGAQTPAETMRLLGHAVLGHQVGGLEDDATLLVLAWHGPPTDGSGA
ncbi:MAG TPA: PP2C family protein-serine/threonine phosphatase [Acidimicrobiales bacterium]|nr:PP2C family protein-serine/threonine phosphatase [Acidimicrobiales bacterium]